MVKRIKLALIATVLIGSAFMANAASYRVNSKGGAHFVSVAEAMATTISSQYYVQAGDTLYAEPGHVEPGDVTLNKKIILIGPGYNFAETGNNIMNAESAVFHTISTNSNSTFSEIHGCVANNIGLYSYCVANRCKVAGHIHIDGGGCEITNCYIKQIAGSSTFLGIKVIGNIIGLFPTYDYGNRLIFHSSTIANNTIVGSTNRCILDNTVFSTCEIYNNIIINTNTNLVSASEDTVSRYTNYTIHPDLLANNSIHHNVLSTVQCPGADSICNVATNVYGATVESIFVNNGLMEGQYELKSGSPAAGAASDGGDCGAYGGVKPYKKGGQPAGIPYIYDATFSNPSENNTINATFKVRITNE